MRSPTRSVAIPQRSRLRSEPTSELESSSPVCASDRWSRSRSAGAITAMPNQIAEYVVCANVPAARTAHLYLDVIHTAFALAAGGLAHVAPRPPRPAPRQP